MWLADDRHGDDGQLNTELEPDPDPCGGLAKAASELLELANKTTGLDHGLYSGLADMTSLLYENLEGLAEDIERLKAEKEESNNDTRNSDYSSSRSLSKEEAHEQVSELLQRLQKRHRHEEEQIQSLNFGAKSPLSPLSLLN
jgi:hypothetical protein